MAILAESAEGHIDLPRFEGWVRRQARWGNARVLDLEIASRSNGYSNETYVVRVKGGDAGDAKWVLRLPPRVRGLFPEYDMTRQFGFMRMLEAAGLAVPECLWVEPDPEVLGRPFFVMSHLDGVAAPDVPSYLRAGWLLEASPSQRRLVWDGVVAQLARLATVEPSDPWLKRLDWPDAQQRRLAQHIAQWDRYARWGAAQLPPTDLSDLHRLRDWLIANMPQNECVGVVWGDPRIGNVLFQGVQPLALLDWELAVIGDPMADIAYFLFHVFLMELQVLEPYERMRLPGFRSDRETLERYGLACNADLTSFRYYWLFNAYKMFGIWQCKAALMLGAGVWTPEQAEHARRAERLWAVVQAMLASADPVATPVHQQGQVVIC